MYLDLMDILRAPGTTLERAIDLPPADLDDVRFVSRIRGRVKAANARRNIVISGHASSDVEMRCSRCLRLFAAPLEMELEAVAPVSFFRAAPNTVLSNAKGSREESEDDGEEELDDETASIFDAHSVDVLELLRQAAVLSWPIQPLCAQDCAGLPEATRYKGEAGDDRWSALRALAVPAEASEPSVEAEADGDEDEDADWTDDLREDELAEAELALEALDDEAPREKRN